MAVLIKIRPSTNSDDAFLAWVPSWFIPTCLERGVWPLHDRTPEA
jgi:hypothetical protein